MSPHPVRSDRFVSRSKTFSRAAALFVVLIGVLVLIGWMFDIHRLKGIYNNITMKPNTSVALILAGASLWLLNRSTRKAWQLVGQLSAATVALIGLLSLSQHIIGWDLGIDQLLFTEPPGALATTSPGRMGVTSSSSFTMFGIALLLLYRQRAASLAQVISMVSGYWVLLALIGYTYRAEELFGIARYTGIALHTAVALFVLCLGILGSRVDQGIVAIMGNDSAAGMMARRLALVALGVPYVMGWLRVAGQRAGYFDLGFGTAVFASGVMMIFLLAIWRAAKKLQQVEQQRLATEAVALAGEERVRRQAALIDLSYEAILFWDMDQGILEWNQGCEQLYGYSKNEAVGQKTHVLLKTKFPCDFAAYERTLERDGHWSGVLRHRAKDGSEVLVESRQQLTESNGQRLVLETNRDITERTAHEQQLTEQAHLLDLSFDAIFVRNPADQITYWSKGAEEAYGYTTAEALGRSPYELLQTVFPEPLERIIEKLHRDGRWVGELTHTHKDGSKIIDSSRWVLDRDPDGNPLSILETNNDITKRKQAEEERERLLVREQALRVEAERAARLKEEFLATVSHELRTPLNAMLGWATMLRTKKMDPATSARAIEAIERNAKSQAELVEDLLDVSRITSGNLRLDVKPIALTSVVKAALESVQPAADAKGIRLEIIVDPAADNVRADAARLQQVVWNLLSNSIKFTPAGGTVTVKVDRTESMAQVTVSDTGQGISADFLPFVFDRFKQADGSITRNHGGLGLGLAIARHLMELHGGTIRAQSAGEGLGASFQIRLPLVPTYINTLQTEPGRTTPTLEPPRDLPSLHQIRILVVDDEVDAREMLRAVLEELGANVTTASSAQDALVVLQTWKPFLIVSDIGMPGEDGYSLIKKIRELPAEQGGAIPAIALTGYVRVEERMRALGAGYQMFVPKPVEVGELAAMISSLVGTLDGESPSARDTQT